MWGPFTFWIRWLLGKEQVPTYASLPDLLGNTVRFKDVRSEMMGPKYTNPRFSIPRRDVAGIERVVLHCSADDDKPGTDVYGLAKYDISPECHINPDEGCPTITYHYYIEFVNGDCVVYWCLDHDVRAWHVGSWNKTSLAVAMDYDGISNLPALKWEAAAKTVAWLLHELGLPTMFGAMFHRELQGTGWSMSSSGEKVYRKQCPGESLDPWEFRRKVDSYLSQL